MFSIFPKLHPITGNRLCRFRRRRGAFRLLGVREREGGEWQSPQDRPAGSSRMFHDCLARRQREEASRFEPRFIRWLPIARRAPATHSATVFADFTTAHFFGNDFCAFFVGGSKVDLRSQIRHEHIGLSFGLERRVERERRLGRGDEAHAGLPQFVHGGVIGETVP